MNIQEVMEQIKKEFDYLPFFSTPIPGEKDGVETFVIDVQTVHDFLTPKLQEIYQQGRKDGEVETRKYILEKLQNHEICTNCLKEIKLEEGEKNISEWCADCWEEN